jgi:hypothetical protein
VDALEVKKVLERELKKLVAEKVITEEAATLPYLGEIPEQAQGRARTRRSPCTLAAQFFG